MVETLRFWVLALLKVPAEPHPPSGEPASLRVFRAGRNYYKLRLAGWAAAQLLALAAVLFWTAILIDVELTVRERKAALTMQATQVGPNGEAGNSAGTASVLKGKEPRAKNGIERLAEGITSATMNATLSKRGEKRRGFSGWVAGCKQALVEIALQLPGWVFPLLWLVKIGGFLLYLVQIPVTYAVRRLDFEMRWYMVTDRSLRLRHGVWRIAESTMSFANIQQVTVSQGPLQRLLGLADLKVQSAGGGSTQHSHHAAGDDMHVGWFRHVTNAPEIRDLILDRLRRFRESGMGDPDERVAPIVAVTGAGVDPALEAARELLAEARALRATLS